MADDGLMVHQGAGKFLDADPLLTYTSYYFKVSFFMPVDRGTHFIGRGNSGGTAYE
jgi:hypothetical protein